MNLFLNLLGLSAFVFGLRSWRLVYRRGWRKVLPVFSLYILFYCLSTVPVFLLRVHSLAHPEQRIACLIYQYTNWAVYLISILFLIMVLYELLLHTIPNQGNIRRRSSALFASGAVALAAIGVLAFRSCFHVAYCCWIDWIAHFAQGDFWCSLGKKCLAHSLGPVAVLCVADSRISSGLDSP